MGMEGYYQALRYFGEVIAPGMAESVRTCHIEQMSQGRADALIEVAQSVGGVSIRPIAEAGETFYGGLMVKLEDSVLYRGVFEPEANCPIPLDREPIKVRPGNVAVALETMREAEEDALNQVKSGADEIYPVSRDLQHLLT